MQTSLCPCLVVSGDMLTVPKDTLYTQHSSGHGHPSAPPSQSSGKSPRAAVPLGAVTGLQAGFGTGKDPRAAPAWLGEGSMTYGCFSSKLCSGLGEAGPTQVLCPGFFLYIPCKWQGFQIASCGGRGA